MLWGHLTSPFSAPPSNVPCEESATILGQQPELNDSVAAEHLVISSSEMKKKLKKKKKNSFSLGGLVSDHYHNMLDQLNQGDTLLPASPREVAMAML